MNRELLSAIRWLVFDHDHRGNGFCAPKSVHRAALEEAVRLGFAEVLPSCKHNFIPTKAGTALLKKETNHV